MAEESSITVTEDGITFAGPDAVAVYRANALRSGLTMYAKYGMKPNRSWTPSAMLRAAGQITGKTYKRGAYKQATEDLKVWADTMASALPISDVRRT